MSEFYYFGKKIGKKVFRLRVMVFKSPKKQKNAVFVKFDVGCLFFDVNVISKIKLITFNIFLFFILMTLLNPPTKQTTCDVILKKKSKIIFFSPPGGARELKLRPFDSESKTTSDCSNSLFSKKSPLAVCFHSTNNSLIQLLEKSGYFI